jgi:ABC-type transporter Mla subunit MlaD
LTGWKTDINAAFVEYHRVTRQIVDANSQLDTLKAQLADLEARANAQQGYLTSLGENLR